MFVLAGFVLVVPLADLLLDFLGHLVNGGVEVAFGIHGKEVRATDTKSHRTAKLLLRHTSVIVFESYAGIDGPSVKMFQFIKASENVVFDGFRQRQIMR